MAIIESELEKRCRSLVAKASTDTSTEPTLFLRREMALTLDHLDRSRKMTEDLLRRTQYAAGAVRHRMLNLGSVPYEYAVGLYHERDGVRNNLRDTHLRIEMAERGILAEYNREIQKLQGRLLALWNKHEMLAPSHGYRAGRA